MNLDIIQQVGLYFTRKLESTVWMFSQFAVKFHVRMVLLVQTMSNRMHKKVFEAKSRFVPVALNVIVAVYELPFPVYVFVA